MWYCLAAVREPAALCIAALWQVVVTGEFANVAGEVLRDLLVEEHLNLAAESLYCLNEI